MFLGVFGWILIELGFRLGLGQGLGLGLVFESILGLGLGFGLVWIWVLDKALGLDSGFGQDLGLSLVWVLGLVNRWRPPRLSTFLGENCRRRTTKSGYLQIVTS